MSNYTTLDYLPDLTPTEINSARKLTFNKSSSNGSGWDNTATFSSTAPYAIINDTFYFYAIKGATYDIISTSYFDPFLLRIYDITGNTIIANNEADDGADFYLSNAYYSNDIIFNWVAPYSGKYFVSADWNQGNFYKFHALSIYEDIDTVVTVNSPIYSILNNVVSVNEGSNVTYTVSTTGVTSGTVLGYQLTGVSASDVVGGNLTGNVTIGTNGQGIVNVSLAADQQTEGNETLVLNLLNGGIVVGNASPVTIVDTSTATMPPVVPPSTPFASTDDFVVLQPSTSAIAGAGVGNDTYLLSGTMIPAGKAITISDALGTNTLQLAPGLSVASSQVSATALKLTLTNGASLTVLGADKFSYDVGGNLSAGLNPPDLSFAQFVQNTLGTTLPTTGLSNGGALVVGGGFAASLLASTASGDDFIVAQVASSAIIGAGAGNDTYLLSPSLLPAGANLTISDALGVNSIQVASGLQIASAQVTATALKLNLTSGATVTVLGADRFTFEAGGNTSAGINQADISYSQFVQSVLGTTVPTTGISTSGAITIGGSGAGTISVSGNQVVNATAAADVFSFNAVSALVDAAGTNTQATVSGFLTANDRLAIDLAIANSAITTLAQLNGQQGVSVQVDPFAGATLINFGNDANGGQLVTLSLTGVIDPATVQISVV